MEEEVEGRGRSREGNGVRGRGGGLGRGSGGGGTEWMDGCATVRGRVAQNSQGCSIFVASCDTFGQQFGQEDFPPDTLLKFAQFILQNPLRVYDVLGCRVRT